MCGARAVVCSAPGPPTPLRAPHLPPPWPRPDDYEKAKGKYIITPEIMGLMRRDAVVMHPLPRVDEITPDCDDDPRAAYFRQARNGLYVRMALLKLCMQDRFR